MSRTSQQPKKTDSEFSSSIIGIAVLAAWIVPEIITMAQNDIFITRLSPAVAGGIAADQLTTANVAMYIAALAIKFLTLAVMAWAIISAVRPMARGEVFTLSNARWLRVATWALFIWGIARIGIEGLANNFAASTLDIDSWWDTGAGTPLSDLAPALILMVTLGLMSTIIRRGVPLKEEVDGLV